MCKEVEIFKNELSCYYEYRDQLAETELKTREILKKDQEEIDDLYYLLSGVKAADPSRVPIGGSPEAKAAYQDKLRNKIDKAEKRKEKHKEVGYQKKLRIALQIIHIEDVLSKLDEEDRKTCLEVFCISKKKKSLEKKGRELYISKQGLHKSLNKKIKKALEKS